VTLFPPPTTIFFYLRNKMISAIFLALLAASAQGWKGQFSSTTESSSTKTKNPLEQIKADLRETVTSKLNAYRTSKWEKLKAVLADEALFREFSGRMYGLSLDESTQLSQLWEIEHFKSLKNIGGGVGAYYGANSLAYHNRQRELYTLAWPSAAEVGSTDSLTLVTIDTLTGRGIDKCVLNATALDAFAPLEVMDMAVHPEGVLAWVRQQGPDEQAHALAVIRDDQGKDFENGDGDCICVVEILPGSEQSAPFDDTLNTAVDSEDPQNAGYNAALAVNPTATGGTARTYTFAFDREVRSLDGLFTTVNVLDSAATTRFHSADYDGQHEALWVLGQNEDYDFLCGFHESDILVGNSPVNPQACFEIPAIEGFAIEP